MSGDWEEKESKSNLENNKKEHIMENNGVEDCSRCDEEEVVEEHILWLHFMIKCTERMVYY